MCVEGPAQKAWPGHTTCGGRSSVPTSSHPTAVLVRRLSAGAEGRREKRPELTASSSSRITQAPEGMGSLSAFLRGV